MLLKDDFISVQIGGLTFRSHNTSDPQFVFDPTAVTGWTDGVNIRRETISRSNSWGDFKSRGQNTARLITLSGIARGKNADQLHLMRDAFMSILRKGEEGVMSLQNSLDIRYANVYLSDSTSWIQKLDNVAAWRLELYAPDPRIFGQELKITLTDSTMSGGLDTSSISYPLDFAGPVKSQAYAIQNFGNVDAWPRVVVTGDYHTGFSVTNGRSRYVTFDGVVTRSAPVTIDMDKGTAIQNNTDKSHLLSRRDWFSIPPNGSSIQPMFLPKEETFGWCDIIYRDTWI